MNCRFYKWFAPFKQRHPELDSLLKKGLLQKKEHQPTTPKIIFHSFTSA